MFAEASDSTTIGMGAMALGLIVLILPIAWLVFPFIVVSKVNQVIRALREFRQN